MQRALELQDAKGLLLLENTRQHISSIAQAHESPTQVTTQLRSMFGRAVAQVHSPLSTIVADRAVVNTPRAKPSKKRDVVSLRQHGNHKLRNQT